MGQKRLECIGSGLIITKLAEVGINLVRDLMESLNRKCGGHGESSGWVQINVIGPVSLEGVTILILRTGK